MVGALGATLSSTTSATPLLFVSVIVEDVASDSSLSVKPSPSLSSSPSNIPSSSLSLSNEPVPAASSSASFTPSLSSSVSALSPVPSLSVSVFSVGSNGNASFVLLAPSPSKSSLFRGSIVMVNSATSILSEISAAWTSKIYCCFSK